MNYILKEIKTEEDFKELEKDVTEHELRKRKEIIHELKTQNNQMTAHPMYCVMELTRFWEGKPEEFAIEILREIFFTNREAEFYIEENKHDHDGELFIYVKSGYKNDGWQVARELMLNGDVSRIV